MNIDNILRSLNKYLNDIYDTFGGKSKEYMRAMKQVKEALPEPVLEDTARQGLDYSGDAPEEPLQISRSKASKNELEAFGEDLRQLRELQKDTGTARRQAKKYIDDAKDRGLEIDDEDLQQYIKDEAQHQYDFDNSTNDWYEDVMSDDDIPDDWKEEIRDMYSNLNEDYDDANFRDELEIMVKIAQRKAKAARKHNKSEPEEPAAPSGIGYSIDDDFGGLDI